MCGRSFSSTRSAAMNASSSTELDPLTDGFVAVLVEVYRRGDEYVLMQTAPVADNRLLRFFSKDKGLVAPPSPMIWIALLVDRASYL